MESILVSSTIFVVVFGGALAGMHLRRVLPVGLLGPDAKDVIQAGDRSSGDHDRVGPWNVGVHRELFLSGSKE